jgi:Phage integrase family
MGGLGLRAETVCNTVWADLDLRRGRISVKVKGGHEDEFPIAPDVLEALRGVYRQLDPEPDDHVFTVERHLFVGNRPVIKQRDPKRPASTKSLWEMVQRVCRRARVRPFGPHALRHGFATRFLRESERDVVSLQRLLGHSKIETTLMYVDELRVEELAEVLRRIAERRVTSVADLDNDRATATPVRRNRRDGPGRSRTSARRFPGRAVPALVRFLQDPWPHRISDWVSAGFGSCGKRYPVLRARTCQI